MKTAPAKATRMVPEVRPTAALQMYLETLCYKTRDRLELINITKDLNEVVRKHGLKAGFILVQSLHTTTAIFINEFQQALLDDIKSFLERLVGRIRLLAPQRSQTFRMQSPERRFPSPRHGAGPHAFSAGARRRTGARLLAIDYSC